MKLLQITLRNIHQKQLQDVRVNKTSHLRTIGHPSIVLYNWRRLDAEADICMENLSTLNNFFDGRDESWFYLITVEVEAKGAASVVPMMLSIDAIQRHNEEKEMQVLRKERLRDRTESTMSLSSDKSQESAESHGAQRIVRIGREDSSWNVDDSLQRKLLNSVGDIEQESEIRDEEALIGELTALNVAVYVSMQLRKIADSIKVNIHDNLCHRRQTSSEIRQLCDVIMLICQLRACVTPLAP